VVALIPICLLVVLLFPTNVYAQVVINEVFPNPADNEAGAEWVELYNLSDEPASLADCVLYLHESDINQKVEFEEGDFIDGVDKYKVISWDKTWLKNSGDTVRLICSSFKDKVSYGDAGGASVSAPKEGMSIGRSPDGTGDFFVLNIFTLVGPNSQPPTSTPVPTNSPTPTPIPKPTSTFTPTPTPKPKKTPTLTQVPTKDEEEGTQILGTKGGEDDIDNEKEQTSDPEKERGKFPLAAGAFVLTGLGLISFPVVNYLRLKRGYNQKNE
jgi:hypothetical protein